MNRRRPGLLPALLLAALLLIAQQLGLAHRVLHAPGLAGTAWAQDHDIGDGDCRLVDQAAHADALCAGVAPAPAPQRAETATPPCAATAVAAAAAAAYLARAPPRG